MFSYLGKLKDEKLSAHSPIGPLFLLLSLILLFVEGGAYSEQLDDAFITYRYAENLVNGNGLVFNVGEYVEGYTNLSWTLLVALGLLFDFPAWLVGHYLQLFSAALLLIGSYKYTSSILPRAHWIAGCVPLALLASNTFATWTSSGLETPLFAGLVVWAFYFYNRNRMLVVSVLCVLATMDGLKKSFLEKCSPVTMRDTGQRFREKRAFSEFPYDQARGWVGCCHVDLQ